MLDDFRKQIDPSLFDEEEEPSAAAPQVVRPTGHFLGITPFQRFIIAVMLLAIVCLLGSLGLLVTGKVVLPFMF
jgi:hypothetical protein